MRASYLDHAGRGPTDVLRDLAAAGHRRAVLVPLLLTAAYHGRVDIPAAVAAAAQAGPPLAVRVTDVLGPADGTVDAGLLAGLRRRLAEAEPGRLRRAGAGRGRHPGRARRGARWAGSPTRSARPRGALPRSAYASAAPPAAGVAVARLRAAGARRVAVARVLPGAGPAHDAVAAAARAAGAVAVAAPLADAPELVELVLRPGRRPAACRAACVDGLIRRDRCRQR